MSGSLPAGYGPLLDGLKARIHSARVRAALAANAELIHLYWDMGRLIVEQQERQGWGKSVVERLSADLRAEFPGQKGLSTQNLWFMRQFYNEWNQSFAILSQAATELPGPSRPFIQQMAQEILSQPVTELESPANLAQPLPESDAEQVLLRIVREIPWGQNIDLVTKLKDPRERLWYALQTIEHGWSRAVLAAQIQSSLHARQGTAPTNFRRTLPPPQSDLAEGLFKDRYLFDFLAGGAWLRERELEAGLTTHITRFLLELGKGFAYVGRQYRLEVGGDEFFLDLLFYHLRLHCYVVIDLKTGKFDPRDAGQISFYLEAVDRQVRNHAVDGPSIGLVLCREKNNLVVEYALARASGPTAVATWELTGELPGDLKDALPTAGELEAEFARAQREEETGDEE